MPIFYVPLSQGKHAAIDGEDAPRVLPHRWHVVTSRVDGLWYAATSIDGKIVKMHRLITGLARVDHKDGDGLNNRRANLRLTTQRQNCQNRRVRRDSVSGFKGVALHKRDGRYYAHIQVNGKRRHLGTFTDPIAAAHVYDEAARDAFGEFARTNFPGVGVEEASDLDLSA